MKYSRLVEKNLFTKNPSIKILLEEEEDTKTDDSSEKEMKDPFDDVGSEDSSDSSEAMPTSDDSSADDTASDDSDPMRDALEGGAEEVSKDEQIAKIKELEKALDAVAAANEEIENIVTSFEDEGDFEKSFDDDVADLLDQYMEQSPLSIEDSHNRKLSTLLYEADDEEVKDAIDDLNVAFEERKKIPPTSEWIKLAEKYLDNWDIVDTAHEILKKIQFHFQKFTDPQKDIKFNEFLDKFKILVKNKGGVLDKNSIDAVNYSTQIGAKDKG